MILKPLPVEEALQTATQIAYGLQEAHNKGVVHRDIKSANIMNNEKGQVKIMDFGLAKVGAGIELTKQQSTLGTASYMSPEQTTGEDVDQRSDIWSLGVVFYEMLTGALPFKGDYEQAVIYSILNEEPGTPQNNIPEDIWTILKKALAKNPDERYASVDEFLSDIKSFQSESANINIISSLKKPVVFFPLAIILLFITWWIYNNAQINHIHQNILPQIEQMAQDISNVDNGILSWHVFNLAEQAREVIPQDPLLKSLYPKISKQLNIHSEPAGADVFAKGYSDSSSTWQYLGKTPLDSVYFPRGYSKIKLQKDGYLTQYDIIWSLSFKDPIMSFKMLKTAEIPQEMVLIAASSNTYQMSAAPAGLHMPGLEQMEVVNTGEYLMDRYEVTNKEYKNFIDSGGYKNQRWWKLLLSDNTNQLSWDKALQLFIDRTGQPGPSNWEIGDYPAGQDDFPVSGISLYEAAAYAAYVGKSLPSIYHWDRAAFTWASSVIVPQSNLSSAGLLATGSTKGMNRFGVYDMAGNVREWCLNRSSRGGHFILGGGWNDPAYAFNDAYAQQAMDRSEINGFRCIKYLDAEDSHDILLAEIKLPFRDFLSQKQVSDQTFDIFLKQFSYDNTDLKAIIEEEVEEEEWIKQKITFNAAYGNEQMMAYLFLPKNGAAPYQTAIYFPGSNSIHNRSSESLRLSRTKFLMKSGRALMYPIYKSTYERGDGLKSDYPDQTNFWKEHVIMWTKDFSRSIDYLQTRKDIDSDKLVYFGVSWGGAMGGIIPAVEKRIKGSLLLVAGLLFQPALPEVEAVNYLPRIKVPVLMLNGKYDFFFPYETSQLPFYTLLGTAPEHKKILVYEEGHFVPNTEFVKESLSWLDKYLGPVK